jgi:putative beta-lysine N-acetyltransferase
MRPDVVTTLGASTVQHGPTSNRVYVMNLASADVPGILDDLEDLAEREGYTKIFAKVRASVCDTFVSRGYVVEARVPGLFRGREDGCFLSLFRDAARARDDRPLEAVLAAARKAASNEGARPLPPGAVCSPMSPADAPAIAALYRDVFATYPFPIHREAYLRETMEHGIRYFCIRFGDAIAAVSSAEMDLAESLVEMTDFATRPGYRGHGLAGILLRHMERAMQAAGVKTAYTIARAISLPINVTFARAGYLHGGTLLNNTGICGGVESMNVWYRSLGGSRRATSLRVRESSGSVVLDGKVTEEPDTSERLS